MEKNYTNQLENISHHKVSALGIGLIILIFGIFGAWAVFAKMDLTIKAPGQIIVESHPKVIKHPKGGVVEKIYVKEGDYVKKGDILLKLKTTQLKEQLISNKTEFQHLIASKARIKAELSKTKPNFPKEVSEDIKKEELKIYNNRIENLKEKLNDINQKINSLTQSINSLKEVKKTKEELLKTYQKELKDWEELYKNGFANKEKITPIKRQIIQLKGDIANINTQIAQKTSQIEELKAQQKLTKSEYKKELLSKLKDINTKLPMVKAKIASLTDEINNSSIYAPASGIVQNMQIHSNGEVISPYKDIMQIIPKTDKLIVEAFISPMDIEKVKVGEKAEINFASYVDPSAKPVEGEVIYVSPDIITDPKDPRKQYYKAYIKITKKGLEAIKENQFKIIPGMPVTVFIKAGKRTFISYILYPLQQLLKGAFHAN